VATTTVILAIVGPTASGKSLLGLYLAKKFNGEIICADSRTVYKGMSIGTAKPSIKDQRTVRHHLLDILEPGASLGAGEFKVRALEKIEAITRSQKMPIIVGGSGLYVDSILFDYRFPPKPDPKLRKLLDSKSLSELVIQLAETDSSLLETIDLGNRSRVIRALETVGMARAKRQHIIPDTLVIGLTMNKEIAQSRMKSRTHSMLREGLIDEITRIGNTYGWDSPALKVIGYSSFKEVAFGNKSIDEAMEDCVRDDMNLYKKQLTWFRRNDAISWIDTTRVENVNATAENMVSDFLFKIGD
jgi:tRNA dimethylallyltransferase